MRASWKRCGAAVVAAFLALPAGSVWATPTLTTTTPGQSCVVAREAGSGGYTLNSTWQVMHHRCYYSWAVAPAAGETWFDGATVPTYPTQSLLLGYGASSTAWFSSATTERWRNLVVDVSQPAIGYVEFHYEISDTSTLPMNAARPLTFAVDVSRTAPFDGGSLSLSTGISSNTEVTWASWATSEPTYRWGAAYAPLPSFCGAVVTSAPTASASVAQGQTVAFTVDHTPGQSGSLDVEWQPGSNVWTSVWTSAVSTDPVTVNRTVGFLGAGAATRVLSSLRLRCHDLTLSTDLFGHVGEAPSAATGSGSPRPCDAARWRWPQPRSIDVGQTALWHLDYEGPVSGTPTTILVEGATFDETLTHVPAFSTMTFSTVVAAAAIGTHADYPVAAIWGGTLGQFVFRCTDNVGTSYQVQWTSSQFTITTGSGEETEGSCTAGSGIGFAPSSWVPGLGRMVACLGRVMLVPSQASVDSIYDAGATLTERAPISYLAQTAELLTDSLYYLPADIVAGRTGCISMPQLPGMIGAAFDEDTACVAADLGSSSGLTEAREVLGFVFWFGAAWTLWVITRRLIAS